MQDVEAFVRRPTTEIERRLYRRRYFQMSLFRSLALGEQDARVCKFNNLAQDQARKYNVPAISKRMSVKLAAEDLPPRIPVLVRFPSNSAVASEIKRRRPASV